MMWMLLASELGIPQIEPGRSKPEVAGDLCASQHPTTGPSQPQAEPIDGLALRRCFAVFVGLFRVVLSVLYIHSAKLSRTA